MDKMRNNCILKEEKLIMNELLEMIKRCDAAEVNKSAKEPEVVYDDLERVIAESRDAFTASESTELLHVYLLYEPVTGKTYGLLDYGRYPIDTAAIMFGKGVVIIDVMSQYQRRCQCSDGELRASYFNDGYKRMWRTCGL